MRKKVILLAFFLIIILASLFFYFRKAKEITLIDWQKAEKSHFGTLAFEMLDDELASWLGKQRFKKEIKEAIKMGAYFIRPHPSKIFTWGFVEKEKGKYNWALVDFAVRTSQEYNVHLLATVYTWNPNDHPGYFDPWYLKEPNDWGGYLKWLSALVERYDGDGESDMPGLRYPLRYFEIGNEILFGEEKPKKTFIQLLKLSYQTIKQANPQAVVLPGAISLHFIDSFLTEGLEDYIDVLNTHDLEFNLIPLVKEKIKKPIWFSEFIVRSPQEVVTEKREYEKARLVVEYYPKAFSQGVEKVFLASPKFAFGEGSRGILSNIHKFLQTKVDFFDEVNIIKVAPLEFFLFKKEGRSIFLTGQWPGGLPRYPVSLPVKSSYVIIIEATTPWHKSWQVKAENGYIQIDFRKTEDPQLFIEEIGNINQNYNKEL